MSDKFESAKKAYAKRMADRVKRAKKSKPIFFSVTQITKPNTQIDNERRAKFKNPVSDEVVKQAMCRERKGKISPLAERIENET